MLITLFIGIIFACDPGFTEIDIQITTKSWGSEVSWFITSTCSVQSGTYGNYQTSHDSCCLENGEHNLICIDSWGDGWGEGFMIVDDGLYCNDFATGHEQRFVFTVGNSNPGGQTSSTTTLQPGCVANSVKQDLILMIDYSGSISQDEWVMQRDFAATIVEDHLPPDSRVAAMGFGQRIAADGWYFGYDQFSTLTEAAFYLRFHITKLGGSTYLESALEYAITSGNIDWDDQPERKRLMMILTDGKATDSPCTQDATLRALDVKVMVIGIGSQFETEKIECLVNDVDKDIIFVENFEGLSGYTDQVGSLTCQTTQVWKLSEVKAGGNFKFIEYINTDASFSGETQIQIRSNLLQEQFNITNRRIPQGSRVVLGSESEIVLDGCCKEDLSAQDQICNPSNVTCFYFPTAFSSDYVNNPSQTTNWYISVSEFFQYSNEMHMLEEVSWDLSFPVVESERSLELKQLGYDATQGANYRVSCDLGGSPGVTNLAECVRPCNNTMQCNNGADSGSNSCDQNAGCQCSPDGFYAGTTSCERIPEPSGCIVLVDASDTSKQIVRWNASAGSQVYGYTIREGISGEKTSFTGVLEYEASIPFSELEDYGIGVKAIGMLDVNLTSDPPRRQAMRWSSEVDCPHVLYTNIPTKTPSGIPTATPTHYQPWAFLGDFATDANGNVIPLVYSIEEMKVVTIRTYFSVPFATDVNWTLSRNDAIVESGTVTFPPDALASGGDIQRVSLQNIDTIGEYKFSLVESQQQLPDDPTNRTTYLLYDPYEIELDVRAAEQTPTLQPTHIQPFALVSSSSIDNVTGEFSPLSYYSNEDILVEVRITASPDYALGVRWVLSNEDGTITYETGTIDFPPLALFNQRDLQTIRLTNASLPNSADETLYSFSLLESNSIFPDEEIPRPTYRLYTPFHQINIRVLKPLPIDTFSETVTETKSELDWWLILIIVGGGLLLAAFIAFIAYSYYKKYKQEKEIRKDAEHNLALEEDGMAGFFERGGVADEHVQDNPLHASKTDLFTLSHAHDKQAQMIHVANDDKPFEFSQKRTFGPRQINRSSLSENAPPDSPKRQVYAVNYQANNNGLQE